MRGYFLRIVPPSEFGVQVSRSMAGDDATSCRLQRALSVRNLAPLTCSLKDPSWPGLPRSAAHRIHAQLEALQSHLNHSFTPLRSLLADNWVLVFPSFGPVPARTPMAVSRVRVWPRFAVAFLAHLCLVICHGLQRLRSWLS